jgi:hypothetical protein
MGALTHGALPFLEGSYDPLIRRNRKNSDAHE